jgi:hypothetical protein
MWERAGSTHDPVADQELMSLAAQYEALARQIDLSSAKDKHESRCEPSDGSQFESGRRISATCLPSAPTTRITSSFDTSEQANSATAIAVRAASSSLSELINMGGNLRHSPVTGFAR